jgi:MoaA/NifB/PqqE/SkfB family radical SAM enzyme
MEGSPSRREELPLDRVLAAISECQALGIGTLSLTGGEPLLYRGLDQVLRTAAQIPQLQILLCTNGTRITQRHTALFREVNLRVSVSIDGAPAFHDYFRNRAGSFRAAERGVRRAVEAGVPVSIVTTISQANLDSLPATVAWAAGFRVSQLFVQPLLNLGRGTKIAGQCLTFEQMNRLILQLSDLANRFRHTGLSCQVVGASRKFLLAHPCGAFVCNGTGCHRGVSKEIKKLVVREDGTVLPEVPNLSHEFALGNIRDRPLSILVRRYFNDGYSKFDSLCRTAYGEILPTWDCVIVPWEQILAERSRHWTAEQNSPAVVYGCGGGSSTAAPPAAVRSDAFH